MGVRSAFTALFKSNGEGSLPGGIAPGGDIPFSYGPYGYAGSWPWLLPSTRIDYKQEAGDLTQNSIIMACLNWVCRTAPDAPIGVRRKKGGAADFVPDHPLVQILAQPNGYYNGLLLLQATLISFNLAGNAYWLKARNGSGQVRELWYEPHTTCRPVWSDDGKEFISGYQVMRRGQWSDPIPREDVVHFRNGIDPMKPRMGLSPLASALREVFTDNEAANFSASLLRNMGIPGVVISPAAPDTTIDDPEGLKRAMVAKFGGDRRGEPLVMQGPTKIDVLSFSPEQMNLESLRNLPEERICALLGIPPMLVGLGSGLDASTLANYEQAERAGYRHNLLPTQKLLAAQLDTDLLPEFGDPHTDHVAFNTSEVRALSDDQNQLFARVSLAYSKGVLKRSEARAALGQALESGPDDEVYITDLVHRTETIQEADPPDTLLDQVGNPKGKKALPTPTTTEDRVGRQAVEAAFTDVLVGLFAEHP